jgi:hypothetical protein
MFSAGGDVGFADRGGFFSCKDKALPCLAGFKIGLKSRNKKKANQHPRVKARGNYEEK